MSRDYADPTDRPVRLHRMGWNMLYRNIYFFCFCFFLFFSFFALLLGFLISKIFQIQNRNMTSESRCWEISSPFSPEVMGFEGLNAKFSAFFPPVCIVVSAFIQGMSLGRSPLVNVTNYSFNHPAVLSFSTKTVFNKSSAS